MATNGRSTIRAVQELSSSRNIVHKLISRNANLQLSQNRLYNLLGPEKAPFAYAVMQEDGRVQWHNYADNCRGVVGK